MCRLPFVLWSPEYDSEEFDRVFRPDLMARRLRGLSLRHFRLGDWQRLLYRLQQWLFPVEIVRCCLYRIFSFLYLKMIFVIEEDKPKNSPHIVGVIGIEKIHRPALAGRRKTS